MPGLVLELQREAMEKDTPVTALLRMAKVIAVKLNLPESMAWIDAELKGYTDVSAMPEYRFVKTHVRVNNPYRGWEEVNIAPQELRDAICNQQMFEGVPVIQSLLERLNRTGGSIGRSLSAPVEEFIRKQMPVPLRLQAQIDGSALEAILDGVRTRILEWVLDLEARGVIGEGMTFSEGDQERAKATPVTTITIGSIGSMSGAIGINFGNQEISTTQSAQGDFVTQVRTFATSTRAMLADAPEAEAGDVRVAIADVESEIERAQPEEGGIKKALRKVAAAAVGLGSFAAQAAITTEIGRLLGAK